MKSNNKKKKIQWLKNNKMTLQEKIDLNGFFICLLTWRIHEIWNNNVCVKCEPFFLSVVVFKLNCFPFIFLTVAILSELLLIHVRMTKYPNFSGHEMVDKYSSWISQVHSDVSWNYYVSLYELNESYKKIILNTVHLLPNMYKLQRDYLKHLNFQAKLASMVAFITKIK